MLVDFRHDSSIGLCAQPHKRGGVFSYVGTHIPSYEVECMAKLALTYHHFITIHITTPSQFYQTLSCAGSTG